MVLGHLSLVLCHSLNTTGHGQMTKDQGLMTTHAKLVVTTGPDRGKMFDMTEELIHVGRGSENQIVLSDPALSEHQMSIVSRNGRYAIYTPTAEGIEVEGNVIPP